MRAGTEERTKTYILYRYKNDPKRIARIEEDSISEISYRNNPDWIYNGKERSTRS